MQLPAPLTIDMSLSLSLSSFVSRFSETTHMYTHTHTHVQQPTAKCSWLRGGNSLLVLPSHIPGGGKCSGTWKQLRGALERPRASYVSLCVCSLRVRLHVRRLVETHLPPSVLPPTPPPPPLLPLVSPVFVTLVLPPLLFHPSWLCPSPPFFPPSILLSAGRRWVMPLAGRLKLSPSSSKYIFSIPLLPGLFYVSFSLFSHTSLRSASPSVSRHLSALFCRSSRSSSPILLFLSVSLKVGFIGCLCFYHPLLLSFPLSDGAPSCSHTPLSLSCDVVNTHTLYSPHLLCIHSVVVCLFAHTVHSLSWCLMSFCTMSPKVFGEVPPCPLGQSYKEAQARATTCPIWRLQPRLFLLCINHWAELCSSHGCIHLKFNTS